MWFDSIYRILSYTHVLSQVHPETSMNNIPCGKLAWFWLRSWQLIESIISISCPMVCPRPFAVVADWRDWYCRGRLWQWHLRAPWLRRGANLRVMRVFSGISWSKKVGLMPLLLKENCNEDHLIEVEVICHHFTICQVPL